MTRTAPLAPVLAACLTMAAVACAPLPPPASDEATGTSDDAGPGFTGGPRKPEPGEDLPPGGPECNGVDAWGACKGDVLLRCEAGVVVSTPCVAPTSRCAFVGDAVGHDCVRPEDAPPEAPPPPPDGDDAPAPPSAPDAPPDDGSGGSDRPVPEDGAGGAEVAPPPPDPPQAPDEAGCGDLDYQGRCVGDVAEWCENGAVQSRDCRTQDATGCGWVDDQVGYYCGGTPEASPEPPVAPDPPPDDPQPDPPPNDGGGDVCYTEPWDPDASLAAVGDLLRRDWQSAAVEAMRLRWPAGHALLQDGAMEDLRNFGDGSSLGALAESMMTVIHEGTHGWDYAHAQGSQTFAYFLRGDLSLTIPWIDGFPRAEIADDLPDDSTATYADTYLTGDQGTRGFAELMDEGNCYINGMIALTVLGDAFQGAGISARDGAVAFLLYTQLYLRRARLHHPDVYARLQGDASVRRLVETQWLRAHYWLPFADARPSLGIDDGAIRTHLYAAENLAELSSFLGFPVAASNCR